MSSIEWTDRTWNPFIGCALVSPGCTHCYAMRIANRLSTQQRAYAHTVSGHPPVWTGRVNRSSSAIWRMPYTLKRPSLIFTLSMSDFFFPGADELRAEALDVIEACPTHRFQVLTKRPELVASQLQALGRQRLPDNVWLGVSVEDRKRTERIALLRELPARVRFLSVEPLLGPLGKLDLAGIDWVITGGESGPRARPMALAWLDEVHEQVIAAGVPLFFKQYGKAGNNPLAPPGLRPIVQARLVAEAERRIDPGAVGSKGGALWRGRLHRAFPAHVEPDWPRLHPPLAA